MKAKKKLLPKNFEALLKKGDFAELKAVFDTCDLNARCGFSKHTALAYDDCPDELARWLVAEGADLSAPDRWGATPLHRRASSSQGRIGVLLELGADLEKTGGSNGGTPLHAAAHFHNTENASLLIKHGANVNPVNNFGLTPLEWALYCYRNLDPERMVAFAKVLLAAGAGKTPKAREYVKEIGTRFEFHYSGASLGVESDALAELYKLFDTPPVPRRELHDGKSPINVKATTWQDQHEELWELLVPSSGAATTVQGEVIRIAGRIVNELEGNGGVNWDTQFKRMADAFLEHVRGGQALPPQELEEAAKLVDEVKRKSGDSRRMAQLAVEWVLQNPKPVKLERPNYDR